MMPKKAMDTVRILIAWAVVMEGQDTMTVTSQKERCREAGWSGAYNDAIEEITFCCGVVR